MLIVGLTAIVVLLLVTPRRCRAEDDDHGLLSRVDFRPQTIGSVEGTNATSAPSTPDRSSPATAAMAAVSPGGFSLGVRINR